MSSRFWSGTGGVHRPTWCWRVPLRLTCACRMPWPCKTKRMLEQANPVSVMPCRRSRRWASTGRWTSARYGYGDGRWRG
jgi:hypothetical protein